MIFVGRLQKWKLIRRGAPLSGRAAHSCRSAGFCAAACRNRDAAVSIDRHIRAAMNFNRTARSKRNRDVGILWSDCAGRKIKWKRLHPACDYTTD